MILVIECCGTEVDEPDLWIEEHFAMPCRAVHRCGRRWYCAVVCECLVGVLHQKNVLRLEVGMDKIQVVQEGDTGEQLLRKFLDVRTGEGHEAVALEKVEDALPVQICHDADVVSEIEAVPEVDASVDVVLIVGGQCRQHAQFYATGVPVFWH